MKQNISQKILEFQTVSMSNQVKHEEISRKLEALWRQTNYFRVGKKLSRDEMNER